ncbi:hypothetical protein [Polyangium aurulentum]|uniref:hypothetical protein n=1 Tax=Polyangium aurulentum TaxID=2567896 RepID=UPI0010AE581D|nr:hypothetical protein [Polyangium aurulentum]UQA55994.1 hypothetical protein E8A73_032350 [Polyangium aurulentum]
MSRPAVTILYEDQRGARQGFGLHALVKACVFDAVNGDRPRVEEALRDHRPLKGAGNLLRTCREEIDLIASDGRGMPSLRALVDLVCRALRSARGSRPTSKKRPR